MPILNGVKFSCEPCMRGHRSSKCNHTDRILVKVRKPGRPLSSCPHALSSSSPGTFVHSSPGAISNGGGAMAKTNTYGETHGNGCSCEITSVAIPKVTSCVCGVSDSASKSHASCAASKEPSYTQANTLPSPVSPQGSSTFSMNKVAGSRHRVRRKSVAGVDGKMARRASLIGDDTAMELLRKVQQEVGSPDVKVEGSKYDMIETGLMNVTNHCDARSKYTNGVSFTDGVEGRFSLPDPKVSIQGRGFPVAINATFLPSNGFSTPKPDMGNGMVPADDWDSTLDLPFIGEAPSIDVPTMAKPRGGCCSNSRSASQNPPTNFNQHPSDGGNFVAKPELPRIPIPNSHFLPSAQYSPACDTASALEASLPQPSGTSTVTVSARELAWLHYFRVMGLSSAPPPLPPSEAGFVPDFKMVSGNEETEQSTKCKCGPECNCLGCISHPFNPRTVEYVKELRNFAFDDQQISPFQSQSNSPTLPQSHPNGSVNGVGGAGDSTATPNIGLIIQTSPSPDRESSAGGPDNGVSPSAFVLVDYQIGPCSEVETECTCGNTCVCLNCVSHGRTYGEEVVGNEEEMIREGREMAGNAQWEANGVNGAAAGIEAGTNWWGGVETWNPV